MDSSWLRVAMNEASKRFQTFVSFRDRDKPCTSTTNPIQTLHEFGVTDQLRSFIKGFTLETFKDVPFEVEDQKVSVEATTVANVQQDLTEWQEKHATLVLSTVKEIAHLRYVLCPRHMKERQFWRTYFLLVKSYVTPYEIRYIQESKLNSMGAEKKETSRNKAAIEVEMIEAKKVTTDLDSSLLDDLKNDVEGAVLRAFPIGEDISLFSSNLENMSGANQRRHWESR